MQTIGRCNKCDKVVFKQEKWENGFDNSSGKRCADCGKTLCSNCYGQEEMQDEKFNCCKDCKQETLDVLQDPEKISAKLFKALETLDLIDQLDLLLQSSKKRRVNNNDN